MEQEPRSRRPILQSLQQQPNKQSQDAGQITQLPTAQRNANQQKQTLSGRKQVFLPELVSSLLPKLDKDRAVHLSSLYNKLQRCEITKEIFVLHMKGIVGNEKLSLVANELTLQQTPSRQKNSRKLPFTAAGISQFNVPRPLSPVTNIQQQRSVAHGAQLQYKSQLSTPHGSSVAQVVQGNATPATSKYEPLEKQLINSGFTTANNMVPLNSVSPSFSSQLDRNSPNPSVNSPAGVIARTSQEKPPLGRKKQLEALGSSPPLRSKKQKISGAFSDQNIEQLNDVTAFGEFNFQEEVEQLLSGRKDSRVSEAARSVVHEEEERGILLKTPLHKKLAEIMAKHGLKYISNDVERCLSLSVEQRMHGLICSLIRLSKQRTDAEKPMHLKLITSDVRQQIIRLDWEAKKEWEKNQPEGSGVDDDKQKEDGQVKALKTNKEVDEMMKAAAANIAARAAVGGDDMLSKWQHMAGKDGKKRERGIDAAASNCQASKDVNHKSSSASGISRDDNQDAEKRGLIRPLASGAVRQLGRNQVPQTGVARTISVKDVIAVMKREPQMARSRLIYRLYERIPYDRLTAA